VTSKASYHWRRNENDVAGGQYLAEEAVSDVIWRSGPSVMTVKEAVMAGD
jgi:hypothetical protein